MPQVCVPFYQQVRIWAADSLAMEKEEYHFLNLSWRGVDLGGKVGTNDILFMLTQDSEMFFCLELCSNSPLTIP